MIARFSIEKTRKPKRILWLTPSSDGPFSELQDLAQILHE